MVLVMRSKILQKILDETPEKTKKKVEKYAEIQKAVDDIDEVHTELAKTSLDQDEYRQLSFKLIKVKQNLRELLS